MKPKFTLIFHVLVMEEQFGEDMARYRKLLVYLSHILDFLETNPDVAFSLELSAMEAIMLKESEPRLLERIQRLVQRKQIGLVEGSYSQPHFHAIGYESNIRQFEHGLKALRSLFNTTVSLYFRQESSFHHQLPQILSGFGFRYACTPSIGQTLLEIQRCVLNRPGFIRIGGVYGFPGGFSGTRNKIEDLRGQQRGMWLGLDGTDLSFIFTEPMSIQECLERENRATFTEEVGLAPSNFYHDHPDHCLHPTPCSLDEVDEAKDVLEFVTAEDNVSDTIDRLQSTQQVKLMTATAYCEGHWGELCQTQNRFAEYRALQTEAVLSIALCLGVELDPENRQDLQRAWEKILSAQHHDMWTMIARQMNEASASWSGDAARICDEVFRHTADSLARRIDTSPPGSPIANPLVVFNTLSWPRSDHARVRVSYSERKSKNVGIFNDRGEAVRSDCWVLSRHQDQSIAEAEIVWEACNIPAFGYRTFFMGEEDSSTDLGGELSIQEGDEILIGNDHMQVCFGTDSCGIKFIRELSTGTVVFKQNEESFVAELQAVIHPSAQPELFRSREGRITVRRGRYFAQVVISGESSFGAYSQEFVIGPGIPRVSIETTVSIDKLVEIGEFHKQKSKLRMIVPIPADGSVTYDIPFGTVELKSDKKFFPVSWTAVGSDLAGGMLVHCGTMLHLLRDNSLSNILVVANKRWSMDWENMFIADDQRFVGKRVYQHCLICYSGKTEKKQLTRRAMEANQPLHIVSTECHKGDYPSSLGVLEVVSETVVGTALVPRHDSLLLRVFESQGDAGSASVRLRSPARIVEEGLDGSPIANHGRKQNLSLEVGSWQIKNLSIALQDSD